MEQRGGLPGRAVGEGGEVAAVRNVTNTGATGCDTARGPSFLVNDVLTQHRSASALRQPSLPVDEMGSGAAADAPKAASKKKGSLSGVFIPTCENMWGVLIFLRFFFIVGEAGVWQTMCIVLLSFAASLCTAASMSSIASSGGLVSRGGPYHMISRALGPEIGASVGIMYWLALTMLAVLECLGAVESLIMAAPSAGEFPFHLQAIGSGFLAMLALTVWGGVEVVTRLGVVFAFVVLYTLYSYYHGLITAPHHQMDHNNAWVTGLRTETFWKNWEPHYTDGNNFGTALALFYPCFTGILSGADRADVLKDPPTNIRRGTFAAIIFSFVMYVSLFLLWGAVADYRYLQGDVEAGETDSHLERLDVGRAIVHHIIWNPFPKSAFIGIIIASLSQSLQCLIVAPRLLQQIAKDDILRVLRPFAPLSQHGEPTRALLFTYTVAACLVLIGSLDIVAPLLSMCFLVAYAFMNFSCFSLTVLKSPAWRPEWIHRKRWRLVYLCIAGFGFALCMVIMFAINAYWASVACCFAIILYGGISWHLEARNWGSAMDGIQFKLALNALINLEASQHQCVNWRPQVLILYRINVTEELQGIKHREILRFYSQLRKSRGFCVVACVLESDRRDEATMKRANVEKGLIKGIMAEEGLHGFAEVVVAPTWSEGANYVVQLTGIGGLVPNTVLLDWPDSPDAEEDRRGFVGVLQTALGAEKAVLAVKGLREMPTDVVYGTIDIWWMIHDGGFLILLSWLLSRHRTWRSCQMRVFTVAENVSEDSAKVAAEALSRTLRERQLLNVDVEVIILDHDLLHPYTVDWTLRVEDRHRFLRELAGGGGARASESIPLEIDDLFVMDGGELASLPESRRSISGTPKRASAAEDNPVQECFVTVSDCRKLGSGPPSGHHHQLGGNPSVECCRGRPQGSGAGAALGQPAGSTASRADLEQGQHRSGPAAGGASAGLAASPLALEPDPAGVVADAFAHERRRIFDSDTCEKLGQIIHERSKRAELVVMNLPDLCGTEGDEMNQYLRYCDVLTKGLDRVLFVHSTGHEIFDITE